MGCGIEHEPMFSVIITEYITLLCLILNIYKQCLHLSNVMMNKFQEKKHKLLEQKR